MGKCDFLENDGCEDPDVFMDGSDDDYALVANRSVSPPESGQFSVDGYEEIPWTFDSGATKHLCTRRDAFKNFEPTYTTVRVGGKSSLASPGRGDVIVEMNGKNRLIRDVLYVPKLGFNLLSISALENHGMSILFGNREVKIMRGGTLIAVGRRAKNLYLLARIQKNSALITEHTPLERASPEEPSNLNPEVQSVQRDRDELAQGRDEGRKEGDDDLIRTLHSRPGHPSMARLCAMNKTAFGIPKISAPKDFFCEVCENNKLTRQIRKYRYPTLRVKI